MQTARICAVAALLGSGLLACATIFAVDQNQLKECRAQDYALAVSSADPPQACEPCAQTRCCGAVGRCADDRDPECPRKVREYLRCVARDAGRPAAEDDPRCVAIRPAGSAKDAYECVRDKCDTECGLAGCSFAVEVPRLGPPACDGCLEATACAEINRCYGDRGCKTFIECLFARDVSCLGEVAASGALGCDAGPKKLPACAVPCADVDAGIGDGCTVAAVISRARLCEDTCHRAIDGGAGGGDASAD